MVWDGGTADISKSGSTGLLTVRVTVVVLDRLPLAPVTVSVYVPGGVSTVVITVKVDAKFGDPFVGLKVEVAPDGKPETDNATVEGEPLTRFAITVKVAVSPAFMVWDAVVAVKLKSNG